ncbi:MAG TPA: M48 family metallopeptidase [Planctomycetota bacterium]|nr:M48 family metallopeptidase [Planctomycetota bacterium]
MGVLLVLLGTAVGSAVAGPDAAAWGALGAVGLWGGLWAVAALQGDRILLATAGARRIEKRDHPQLWNVVEEMVLASGLGAVPEVYIIDDPSPNAFAIGRKPERSAVAVTTGLLRLMNRDELQGVVGHEVGHIKNRDSAFMMLVGVMLGAIVILADLLLRLMRFRDGRRSRAGGQVQALVVLLAILLSVLAPLLARLIYFACSRRREYLADASSARFTRYPEGLASALEKMGAFYGRRQGTAHRVLAPLYIVNPMTALAATGLLSTHPPTEERIRILRSMGGGAGYVDYDAAFRKILRRSVIGARTLSAEGASVPVRAPQPGEAPRPEEAAAPAVATLDLVGRLRGLVFMTCPCGVGIQVPAGLGRDAIRCPRCGRDNPVPRARETESIPEAPLEYRRAGAGWESFQCRCGHAVHLSPAFAAPLVACPACGRKIRVIPGAGSS